MIQTAGGVKSSCLLPGQEPGVISIDDDDAADDGDNEDVS